MSKKTVCLDNIATNAVHDVLDFILEHVSLLAKQKNNVRLYDQVVAEVEDNKTTNKSNISIKFTDFPDDFIENLTQECREKWNVFVLVKYRLFDDCDTDLQTVEEFPACCDNCAECGKCKSCEDCDICESKDSDFDPDTPYLEIAEICGRLNDQNLSLLYEVMVAHAHFISNRNKEEDLAFTKAILTFFSKKSPTSKVGG